MLLQLSVIMPCYNEAGSISAAIEEVVVNVLALVPASELVVMDDGSTDDSAEIARQWSARDPRVRVVSQPNAGHGPALVNGIREAHGEWCLLLDSDRQVSLEGFGDTWALASEHEAVLGIRRPRFDPKHRLVLSAAVHWVLVNWAGVRVTDANVPYKLIRRRFLLDAVAAMPVRPRIPSILLTVYLSHLGVRIAEQPIQHRARTTGQSVLRPLKLARFCAASALELWHFRRSLP
ncbi:glycosyltransferase family 2 protein [Ottowia thiooxydans]|uniref:glycosyltransferase family 2 protein n=1 Tax=Ottowia thiooxydans TaxID=219182 RepID=UPI0004040444|nr:glycosyltransferase family 2 protein [Ottowia thiooxydans]